VMVEVNYDTTLYRFTFSFVTNKFFEQATETEPEIYVERDRVSTPLINFLNQEMLLFYTSDLSLIDGYNIFRAPNEPIPPFDNRAIEVVNWNTGNVNIECEFGDAGVGMLSIHSYLESILGASNANVAYYDHGTGEIADFISFKEDDGRILVSLYHCKRSLSARPGHRLDAMSELTAQTVKSVTWTSKNRIIESIRRRFNGNIGSHRFVRGNLPALEELFRSTAPAYMDFEFIAVQPGLQKEGMTDELSNMLAAASDYLVRGNYKAMRIMSS
jgi:hypothetical protein